MNVIAYSRTPLACRFAFRHDIIVSLGLRDLLRIGVRELGSTRATYVPSMTTFSLLKIVFCRASNRCMEEKPGPATCELV